jgi:hypothetical protein
MSARFRESWPAFWSAIDELRALIAGVGAKAGGSSGSGSLSVANVAAASGADQGAGTTLPGTLLYVQTFRRWFELSPDSGATVDGVEVLTAGGGARRWLWVKEMNDPFYASFWAGTTITIDPIAGNDEGNGTVGAPLRNIAEFWRRLRDGTPSGAYTVSFLSAPLATDLSMPVRVNFTNAQITVNGGRTAARSSSLTAGTAVQNSAGANGGTATVGVDSTVVSWTADVGRLLRITSGADTNNSAWVMKDTNPVLANSARLSATRTLASPGGNAVATIASGDAYAVEDPWGLRFGPHDFLAGSGGSSLTYNDFNVNGQSTIEFVGLRGAGGGSMTVTFNRCRMGFGATGSIPRACGGLIFNCNQCYCSLVAPLSVEFAAPITINGSPIVGGAGNLNAGAYTLTNDTYVQASSGQNGLTISGTGRAVQLGPSFSTTIGVAVFDGAVANMFVGRGAIVFASGRVWGQTGGANATGWFQASGVSTIFGNGVQSVTGTNGGGDFKLGQGQTTYRFWNEAGAVYSAAIACTWTNLFNVVTTPPVSAFDVQTGSGIASTG